MQLSLYKWSCPSLLSTLLHQCICSNLWSVDTIFCRLQTHFGHQLPPKCTTPSTSSSTMNFYASPAESAVQQLPIYNIQQNPHKRKRGKSSEEEPVKRPRRGWRRSWPMHWYNAEGKIPCQARGCDRVFEDHRDGDQARISHISGTRSSAEHKVIFYMDRQIGCVHCDYRVVTERRKVFTHEESIHKTCSMSSLRSFITLARRGCIVGDLGTQAAQPIFERMLKNLYELYPSAPRLLYYRAHGREVDIVEETDLIRILAPHWTGPDDKTVPGSRLVHPDDFLWHLAPDLSLHTIEEDWWLRVWSILKEIYRKALI